jgi:hypothetical protein
MIGMPDRSRSRPAVADLLIDVYPLLVVNRLQFLPVA